MDATQAAALIPGQRIQWSDHHIDEVVGNDGTVITVKRGPGYAEMKVPPALPPRGLQAVTMTFAYAALADAGVAFANPSLTEDAPVDGKFYARDGKNGKWVDVSGGVAPPTIDAGIGLVMVGNTIDLEPAEETELGGIYEAPSDGTPYVRQDAAWEPATAGAAIDYRIGLDDTVPGIVDLQPATPLPGEIGGINEPTPDDVVVYARKYDLAGVASWEPISVTGITIADDPPNVPPPIHGQLWFESDTGNTFIFYDDSTSQQWVQIAPGPEAGRDGLPIFYGIGLTRTGLTVDLDPATDLLLGGLTEPLQDGLAYARKYDTTLVPPSWVWEPTTAAGLQITGLIPDKTIIGDPSPLTVNAYGSEFTNTCVLYFDGTAMPTAFVSNTHLTTTVDPSEAPGTPRIETVTVEDTTGPVVGAGAEAFEFMVATTQVDYGIGLSLDTVPTPPMVNLQPAGDSTATLGGVYVVDRVRNIEEGLELGIDGRLRAPLATDSLAGTLLEPPPDDRGYVRRRDLNGVSAWVPPADTQLPDFGIGLSLDETADPDMVNLTPAGPEARHLGGIYVPEPDRSATQGLLLNPVDGQLAAPLATDLLAGSILEPPPDDKGYVRRRDLAGVSQWVPPALPADKIWGVGIDEDTPGTVDLKPANFNGEIGGVIVVARGPTQGLDYDLSTGTVWAPLATPDLAGTITEPIADDKGYVRRTDLAGNSQWVPPALPPVVGDEPPPDDKGYVRRTDLGGISAWVPPALPPLATPDEPGLIEEPIADAKGYVRTTYLDGTSQWVPPAAGGSDFTTVGRSPIQALEEGVDPVLNMRTLWVPLATDKLAGSIVEPPNDGLPYARAYDDMSGAGKWLPSAGGVVVSDTAPATPSAGMLWFNSATGETFLWYVDADSSQWVMQSSPSAGASAGIEEAPIDGTQYARQDAGWVANTVTVQATGGYGDVKMGFQGVDHVGWVRLDGRAVTALTPTQQINAANLGFTTNIPDATDVVAMQPGVARAMGSVAGSWDIGLANLPVHDLSLTALKAESAGDHTHWLNRRAGAADKNLYGWAATAGTKWADELMGGRSSAAGGADEDFDGGVQTTGAHEHNMSGTLPLGGSGTPITPKNMAVNMFVFLGD